MRLANSFGCRSPVDRHIEVHADPAAMAVVGRSEVVLRISGHEGLLSAIWSGRPERDSVVMMMIRERHKHTPTHEPGWLAMTQPFLDVRQRETQLTQLERRRSLSRRCHFR